MTTLDKTAFEIYVPAASSESGHDEIEATFTKGKYARDWLVDEYGANWKRTTFFRVRKRERSAIGRVGETIPGSRCPDCIGELKHNRGRYFCSRCGWTLPRREDERTPQERHAYHVAYVLLQEKHGQSVSPDLMPALAED